MAGVEQRDKKGKTRLAIEIRRIPASFTIPLRHRVLWPSLAPESQLLPYDHLDSTIQLGGFISSSNDPALSASSHLEAHYLPAAEQLPVAILTLTVEQISPAVHLSPEQSLAGRQIQLHKFAVLPELQGQGVGRQMYKAAERLLEAESHGTGTLLHFDARKNQRETYLAFGAELLDETVFVKRGPTGDGPEIEHVRMGKLLRP